MTINAARIFAMKPYGPFKGWLLYIPIETPRSRRVIDGVYTLTGRAKYYYLLFAFRIWMNCRLRHICAVQFIPCPRV